MNSTKNPIYRQNSLKLKDRWINAFQNDLLVNENTPLDKSPDPKKREDPKETDAEPGEDFFNCTKSKRNAEDLKDNPGELEEDEDECGEDVDRDEFRDRVPSVTELQQQLEELMKALINLQVSRFSS